MVSLLRRLAEQEPDAVAIASERGTLTYAAFDQRSDQVAHGLRSRGLVPGDRVLVAVGAHPDFFPLLLGAAKAGVIVVPVNPASTASELEPVIRSARPRLAVLHELGRRNLPAEAPPDLIWLSDDEDRLPAAFDAPPGPLAAVRAEDYVTILYTSGTTGGPKGVVHDHLFWLSFAFRGYGAALDMDRSTRYLNVMAPFHLNGIGYGWSVLARGATLAQRERFSPERYWGWVDDERADRSYLIGAMASMLLARPAADTDRGHHLTLAGTAQLTAERVAEFEARFGVVLVAAYGMTEGGGGAETRDRRRPGSGGQPTPNIDLRITPVDDQPLAPGQPGRIELRDRSAGLAVGYWTGTEKLVPIRADGRWFTTNDLGRVDEDGFIHFVGRTRDLVRRAGENISVVEIEDAIRTHPDVAEVAVVGVPDPVTDEELKAVVELRPSATASLAQLAEHCATRLAPFKVPRYWTQVDELPRTPTLRIQKHLLADLPPQAELDRRPHPPR